MYFQVHKARTCCICVIVFLNEPRHVDQNTWQYSWSISCEIRIASINESFWLFSNHYLQIIRVWSLIWYNKIPCKMSSFTIFILLYLMVYMMKLINIFHIILKNLYNVNIIIHTARLGKTKKNLHNFLRKDLQHLYQTQL